MTLPASETPRQPNGPTNSAQQFHAHLFYKEAPNLDQAKLIQELRKRFESVESPVPKPGLRMFFFPDILVPFGEKPMPAQCQLLEPPSKPIDLGRFETAKLQSWHWPTAFDTLKLCRHEILLSDMLSISLPHQDRVNMFSKFVRSVCETAMPDAIFFLHSDRFDDPAKFMAMEDSSESMFGLLNVRLFKTPDAGEGAIVMDTLGLHALGLPEFQLQTKSIEPSRLAGRLFDYAYYLFEEGPVITDGDRIEGPDPTKIWTCKSGESLVGPERIVLDLKEE